MIKRFFDFTLAFIASLILLPLLIPVIIALRLSGEGEVFYRQDRIGYHNRTFKILKFATMRKNSPNLSGGDITIDKDPRILPLGNFLRKTKINEIPQLFNILWGDMSIIGPRPLTARVAELFPKSHWEKVSNLRPGLSGVGSIVFRNEEELLANATDRFQTYQAYIVPYKSTLESWYVDNRTLWLDIKLIIYTVMVVVFKKLDSSKFLSDLPEPPEDLKIMLEQAWKPNVERVAKPTMDPDPADETSTDI